MSTTIYFIKKHYFAIIIICAIVVKHIITINLPIIARDPIGADEYLMMYQAEQLADGNYLGPYNYLTLVKGIGFPVFLALSYKIGVPLLSLFSIFYAITCLVALIPIRRIIKKPSLQLLAFLLLLFCPATMDYNVQLIYRNMLIIPQSILLVSSLMMVFYHINDRTMNGLVFWTSIVSFAWIFMWHTREDTIWSLPLMLVVWTISIISIIKYSKKSESPRKQSFKKCAIITSPFLVLFASIQAISFINYKSYGIYTTNQLNSSNYTKAVMLMMKVKPTQEVERVEITRDTLLKLYEISPSLATLKNAIEYDYENNTGLVLAHEDNGEINEDLITWELTGAASSQGYYQDAQTAEKFWGDIYAEIKQAIDNNRLETRATLPSRSLIPWPNQPDSLDKLMVSFYTLFIHGAEYAGDAVSVDIATIDEDIIRRYEAISSGYAVRNPINTDAIGIKATRWVTWAHRIKKIYKSLGIVTLVVSLLYYGYSTIILIIKLLRKQKANFHKWLFLSMALGGATAILAGLSYVNAFMVNVSGYLSSCNGLLNLFFTLSITLIIQDVINRVNSLHKTPRYTSLLE